VYYWFPLMTGRMMNERLGKTHFWLTLIGAYATFFPMHFAGLAGEPRHYSDLSSGAMAGVLPLQRGITYAALLLAAAQLLFLVNLFWSMRSGAIAGVNPWRATTLEWADPEWFYSARRTVVRGAYEYGPRYSSVGGEDFLMQSALRDRP